MEITLPISSIWIIAIGSIGVAIAVLTSIFFYYQRRGQHSSDIFLALLLLLSGLTLLNDVLNTSGITNRLKQLYFIPIFYSLSIAPLFYLFIKSKYYNSHAKLDFLHLIIPIMQGMVYWGIGFQSLAYKSSLWGNASFRTFITIESFLFPISLLLYSFLSISLLRKRSTSTYFWNDDLKSWLTTFTKVFVFIALLEFFVSSVETFYGDILGGSFYILRILIFTLFVLWIVYNTIKLSYPSSIYNSLPQKTASLLKNAELDQLKAELLRLMEQEKVYLNSDLSPQILAEYLGITTKKCSHILSNGLGTNFNQFINKHRVEAVKAKVQAGRHKELTLLGIAYECGFESKSTFNRAFKLQTGMTPTQYRKSLE